MAHIKIYRIIYHKFRIDRGPLERSRGNLLKDEVSFVLFKKIGSNYAENRVFHGYTDYRYGASDCDVNTRSEQLIHRD